MIRFLQTPGPIKKIVFGGLLVLLSLAMLVYLIPGGVLGSDTPRAGIIATVSGEEVTSAEVEHQGQQLLRQQFPKGGEQASMLQPYFYGQAAQQLITQQALVVEAKHLGLTVTDAEVADELQHGAYSQTFFPDGKFIGQEQYQALLQNADLSVQQFEGQVKNQILIDKLRNLIAASAVVTDAEVQKDFQSKNTKVKFDYAYFTKDNIEKGLHPADAELQAFYQQNKSRYANSIPETRKLQYVVVNTDKVSAQIPVSQDDLQRYYEEHRDEYRVQDRVNVRHILIKTPLPGPDGKVDQKGADAARQKAEDILKQLKSGGNFAALAKKYSQDPGSATNGGSLGWIVKGQTVPEFEKAAFSLAKGETSGVVQSSYGFHIIHVDDKEDAHVKSLDEVKDQITSAIRQQQGVQAADDEARAIVAQARSTNLTQAAAAKGLQVVTTDFVSRTDSLPGIGSAPQFMDTVFNENVKGPADESQVPQGFVVFQVLDNKPPATPTFEQIRTRVETDFKDQQATTQLQQKTQELADRAKAGHDLKKAAKALGAELKTSDFVLPSGQVPDLGSLSGQAAVAFTLQPGQISGPINDGNVGAVLSILERQEPSSQDFAAKKDQTREELLENKQSEIFNVFLSNLRDQMEKSGVIKINQDEYKALTRMGSSDEGE